MKRVMFVCVGNSCRSQIAEGFARQTGEGKVLVDSAGLQPVSVHPLAVTVMDEVGIDISHQTSKPLSNFQPQDYDVVVSLCGCGTQLPEDWQLRVRQEWDLKDPSDYPLEIFRQVRDEIKERVEILLMLTSSGYW